MSSKQSILLVEGASDEYFIIELCQRLKWQRHFEIKAEKGITRLKQAFQARLKSLHEYSRVWLMIDADNDAHAAWASLRHYLVASQNYTQSINNKSRFPQTGIIHPDDPDGISIGIWIMPNNLDAGMLEDFLLRLMKKDDTLLPEVERAIHTLESQRETHQTMYKAAHQAKAKVHTWLAWQNQPGLSLGAAMKNRLLEFDDDLCQSFLVWLGQLNEN